VFIFSLFFIPTVANAAKGDLGADNSYPQGTLGNLGSPNTKFNIVGIGSIYNSKVIYQSTYATQVQYTIAQGRRSHTYFYMANGADQTRTKAVLPSILAKVQTPKGSIVAVDYEEGASSDKEANTANIILAMQMIKDAGYTPVIYSYKPYFKSYINDAEIAAKFGSNKVWIASYKTTSRQTAPDFNYFPSFDNVAIWQFADNFGTNNSGVDGDVDLTGITDNGYNGTTTSDQGGTAVKTDTTTPAIEAGQQANNTAKSDIKVGDTVKVNYSATKWSNNVTIPSWVKGNSYKVIQVSGNKVLLAGILSWANKSDVEILSVGTPVTTSTSSSSATTKVSGTFKDGGYTITRQNGVFTAGQTLRVFAYPGSQPTGARYYKGQQISYDGFVKRGNYIYVSYKIKGGYHHYIAVRNANTRVLLGSIQ
jgi:hypothetical protein